MFRSCQFGSAFEKANKLLNCLDKNYHNSTIVDSTGYDMTIQIYIRQVSIEHMCKYRLIVGTEE